MIYFIEHDSAGNIVHACCDPSATIVPLINRVTFNDKTGKPLKDAAGNFLSPWNFPLVDPIVVTEDVFNSLQTDGIDQYTCDPTTSAIAKKAPVVTSHAG